jgi:photosystem I subunit 8
MIRKPNGKANRQPTRADGLNFYVAPSGPSKPTWNRSIQYRRLLLARAMTGDFAAAWLPSVFVPLVGIMGPAVAMALLFNVIEARD